ncbi:MAG: hemerythrin domain-containing protein [Burkholderiales bacterium]|nr:hemerythrin domain-containing protein [Burkholderiales bacterium]
MSALIDQWHDEHANFAQLLALLERELARFHEDAGPNYALMLDVVEYLRHYPDRAHHAREDVAFERLAARDPGLRVRVNRLLQEHRVIARAGDELLRLLNEVADEAVLLRADVETAVATYLVYYRHHLATEEREILPRAAALLSPEDWAAVGAAAPAGRDPLFGDAADQRYAALRRLIELEAGNP